MASRIMIIGVRPSSRIILVTIIATTIDIIIILIVITGRSSCPACWDLHKVFTREHTKTVLYRQRIKSRHAKQRDQLAQLSIAGTGGRVTKAISINEYHKQNMNIRVYHNSTDSALPVRLFLLLLCTLGTVLICDQIKSQLCILYDIDVHI